MLNLAYNPHRTSGGVRIAASQTNHDMYVYGMVRRMCSICEARQVRRRRVT